jgi:hypothetical protein
MDLKDLEQFSYEKSLARVTSMDIPNLNGMTTASIDTFYEWLGMSWQSSSNTCLKNGTPYYREYTELELPIEEDFLVEKIDFGYIEPDLEGRYFYKVTNIFYEHSYSSSDSFFRWTYEKNKYIHEVLYHDSISSTRKWERPRLESEPPQYQDINQEPLDISIEAGKALGLRLSSDTSFTYTYEGVESQAGLSHHLPLLLTEELVVRFSNITNQLPLSQEGLLSPLNQDIPRVAIPTPTYLKIEAYGEKKARDMFHVAGEIEEEEEILKHPISTPFEERLLPPGRGDLNKIFWNYPLKALPKLEGFDQRSKKELVWTIR